MSVNELEKISITILMDNSTDLLLKNSAHALRSHAGIINTLSYAKDLTGVDKIHAIIGGFHLPADGGIYEEAMDPTIKEIQNEDPEYIIPCHCTGWKATNKIINLMPDKFIQSAVGITFTL